MAVPVVKGTRTTHTAVGPTNIDKATAEQADAREAPKDEAPKSPPRTKKPPVMPK